MTNNEYILAVVANTSNEEACDLVREKFNCAAAEINESGDIWISGPMTGHWLSDDRKAEFREWCEKF